MTMTPTRTQPPSSLAADVRDVREVPELAERRNIRKRAGLSLAQVGNDVGVSGAAVWQWEMRVVELPVTARTVRYARLLRDLSRVNSQSVTPEK